MIAKFIIFFDARAAVRTKIAVFGFFAVFFIIFAVFFVERVGFLIVIYNIKVGISVFIRSIFKVIYSIENAHSYKYKSENSHKSRAH